MKIVSKLRKPLHKMTLPKDKNLHLSSNLRHFVANKKTSDIFCSFSTGHMSVQF